MKKLYIIMFFLFFTTFMGSCQKDEIIESEPVGYGILSDDYVGSFKIFYISELPYNINQLELIPYYLPHKWAELEIDN